MKKCDVVIGLNYGDEGKGLTTDYLTHAAKVSKDVASVIVARFNGGAQAAHTVKLSDGTSHVFHHYGAGTLQDVPTLLTKYFVVDPMLFFLESEMLKLKLDTMPAVYVDPECPVTTPMEVIFNQTLEKQRGGDRHGSCGVGFGETIAREEAGYHLRVKHCKDEDTLRNQMFFVEEYWHKRQYAIKGVDMSAYNVPIEGFIKDALDFYKFTNVHNDTDVINGIDHVIFEGAQGLNLDQYSPDFPHVTRSSTGLENIALLLPNTSVTIHVHYITRAYLTRHGAGPLKNEVPTPIRIIDTTNRPNDYQGSLRFAELDYDRIKTNVKKDIQFLIDAHIPFLLHGVVTCCDQAEEICTESVNDIIAKVGRAIKTPYILTSWGAIRECVIHPLEASLKDLGIDLGHNNID